MPLERFVGEVVVGCGVELPPVCCGCAGDNPVTGEFWGELAAGVPVGEPFTGVAGEDAGF